MDLLDIRAGGLETLATGIGGLDFVASGGLTNEIERIAGLFGAES